MKLKNSKTENVTKLKTLNSDKTQKTQNMTKLKTSNYGKNSKANFFFTNFRNLNCVKNLNCDDTQIIMILKKLNW